MARLNRRDFIRLAALAAAGTAVASCAPKSGKGGGGGTLVVGRGGDSVSLDLATASDGESWRVGGVILDTLTKLDGIPAKPVPWLAESWETSDSQTWTFKLREGAKFHDGTDCDAEAVKWNFDRWRDENNEWRFGRSFEYYAYQFGKNFAITETKVIDKTTFQLTLKEPSVVLLYKLPLSSFGIASPTAIKEQGDKYGTPAGSCVGSGPFKFTEWVPDDKIVLEPNADWWGGSPKLDQLIFRSIPDNSARLAEFIAGGVHQADLAQTDHAAAEADPNIVTHTMPSQGIGYIAFQQCTPPFDKLEVRQAIGHAINRQALIDAFYTDVDVMAEGFQPPAILGHNPDLPDIEYNPDKAKELLAAAGLPDGFKTEFWYIPVIRGYFPDSKAIGEAIAVDLAKVGIEVELMTEDWGAYLEHRNEGQFPMWMLGWGSDNGDPDNFIGWHFIHSPGEPKKEDCYDSPELAQLLVDGAKETDVNKREEMYQRAEEIVAAEMPRLPIVWPASKAFLRNNVEGYEPVPFRQWYHLASIKEE